MKPVIGVLTALLMGTAWGEAGHPVTFSVVPGGGSVLDANGKKLASQPAAEVSTFVLRPKNDEPQSYTLVRPPFESVSFNVHWAGEARCWLRDDGTPLTGATRFELTRRVRINAFPAPSSVWLQRQGKDPVELDVRDGTVALPSGWHPPPLLLRRAGFLPMSLAIPAGGLDYAGASYPRHVTFLSPRYGPLSYWQFDLLMVAVVAWRRRRPVPKAPPRVETGTVPMTLTAKEEPLLEPPAEGAGDPWTALGWMTGISVVSQGGRRFTITRVLQQNRGTAVLEAARANPDDPPVTVRVLLEERWQQQAMAEHLDQTMRRFRTLTHPNLGKIIDWGVIRGPDRDSSRPFLVEERVSGQDMRTMLASGQQVSSSQVLQWGAELLKALEQAHKRGFFHGAIQPECITVGTDGRARLVDFGWGADAFDAAYRAPEQRCDAAGDVYSVGVILGELLPEPSPAVASVLHRMKARDPAERYGSASEALEALTTVI